MAIHFLPTDEAPPERKTQDQPPADGAGEAYDGQVPEDELTEDFEDIEVSK